MEAADQALYLTQSQYIDTGPTCCGTGPVTSGACQLKYQVLSRWYDSARKNALQHVDLPLLQHTHSSQQAVVGLMMALIGSRSALLCACSWHRADVGFHRHLVSKPTSVRCRHIRPPAVGPMSGLIGIWSACPSMAQQAFCDPAAVGCRHRADVDMLAGTILVRLSM